jgi:hypothetical protein
MRMLDSASSIDGLSFRYDIAPQTTMPETNKPSWTPNIALKDTMAFTKKRIGVQSKPTKVHKK